MPWHEVLAWSLPSPSPSKSFTMACFPDRNIDGPSTATYSPINNLSQVKQVLLGPSYCLLGNRVFSPTPQHQFISCSIAFSTFQLQEDKAILDSASVKPISTSCFIFDSKSGILCSAPAYTAAQCLAVLRKV